MGIQASASVDAHPAVALAALSCFYFVAVFSLSSIKLLWLDELITLHIARLGSARAIWQALARGADPNPPFIHLAVMVCRSLFGEREWALRLPAMLGYWAGILSLFFFLKRRIPTTWALSAVFMSMSMAAFEYAFESRSYGVFYGLAMMAVLCWSRTVDEESSAARRALTLSGMIFALALGVSTNYFAVLAFFPIAAGEMARTLGCSEDVHHWKSGGLRAAAIHFAKHLDLRIWLGMIVAASPLLAFRSLINKSIAVFSPHAWNKVSIGQASDSYVQMIDSMLFPLLAVFVFTGAVWLLSRICSTCLSDLRPRWLGRIAKHSHSAKQVLPQHEIIAVLVLLIYPFLGYLLASLRGGMLSPRFVVPVCFGFAIVATVLLYRLFQPVAAAGFCVLLLTGGWMVGRQCMIGLDYHLQRMAFQNVVDRLPLAQHPSGPIAVPDPLMVLTFQHYAPPALASRIVFPVDFPSIRWFRHEDSPDENLWAGNGMVYHLPIVPLADFLRQSGDFLILGSEGNWMVETLTHHHYPVERIPLNPWAYDIGGFTPLMHDAPMFYAAAGDRSSKTELGKVSTILPFHSLEDMPQPDETLLPIQDR
jgi:hypothetical protein